MDCSTWKSVQYFEIYHRGKYQFYSDTHVSDTDSD